MLRKQKMVLHPKSAPHATDRLSGERSGPKTGNRFAIAATGANHESIQRIHRYLQCRINSIGRDFVLDRCTFGSSALFALRHYPWSLYPKNRMERMRFDPVCSIHYASHQRCSSRRAPCRIGKLPGYFGTINQSVNRCAG